MLSAAASGIEAETGETRAWRPAQRSTAPTGAAVADYTISKKEGSKRVQLELQAAWWRQAAWVPDPHHPQQPQLCTQIVFPGPFDYVSPLGLLGRRDQLDCRHVGGVPRRRSIFYEHVHCWAISSTSFPTAIV